MRLHPSIPASDGQRVSVFMLELPAELWFAARRQSTKMRSSVGLGSRPSVTERMGASGPAKCVPGPSPGLSGRIIRLSAFAWTCASTRGEGRRQADCDVPVHLSGWVRGRLRHPGGTGQSPWILKGLECRSTVHGVNFPALQFPNDFPSLEPALEKIVCVPGPGLSVPGCL